MVNAMTKKRKSIIYLVLFTGLLGLYIKYYYWGAFKYQEHSPDGQYTLKYYESNQWFADISHLFKMLGEKCSQEWVRLYDSSGEKLAEDRVVDCIPINVKWEDNYVNYPTEDGYARWALPTDSVVPLGSR